MYQQGNRQVRRRFDLTEVRIGCRLLLAVCVAWTLISASIALAQPAVDQLDWIKVSADGPYFIRATSGDRFLPFGFNYDHDEPGRLIEDYWEQEWPKIEEDFAEMRQLGANVVRIHLQFGKFMQSKDLPNVKALEQLKGLLQLAEKTKLYLDLTGLACYHKKDVPAWYDALSEADRWAAQSVFWEAIALVCAASPAVFCYDLMNEPVVPGVGDKRPEWLGPPFGDKHFVQFITRETGKRQRPDVAKAWITTLVAAIRKHDTKHLVTVGLVDWSLDKPGLTSGFVPDKIASELDFLAVHIYPKRGKINEALETLKDFAAVGKPVLIEETFALQCSLEEFEDFYSNAKAKDHAAGWVGFYWGKTPDEYRKGKTIVDAIMLKWLEWFEKEAK